MEEDNLEVNPDRKGNCKRCGRCCYAGAFWYNVSEEMREQAMAWTKGRIQGLAHENKPCRHLGYEGTLATCTIYENRPWYCRTYPAEEGELIIKDCGYSF